MQTSDQLPQLVSRFDDVLGQLHFLMRDVEKYRWDAGLVIMVNNGQLDVRGLGLAEKPEHAAAILVLALRSLPAFDQGLLPETLKNLLTHSERVAEEVDLWRGKPEPNRDTE
jgi:hypothetical protein